MFRDQTEPLVLRTRITADAVRDTRPARPEKDTH